MLENLNTFQKYDVPVPLPQPDIQPKFEQNLRYELIFPNNLYCWVLGTPLTWNIKMFAYV